VYVNFGNPGKPESPLCHPDQGRQYTSEQFQRLLVEQGITCGMSHAGEVWDNSATENFFSTLKSERVNRRGIYKTRKEAKADVFCYIECF
jgi:putative transposase